jgi:hypothetical protein
VAGEQALGTKDIREIARACTTMRLDPLVPPSHSA